MFLKQKDNVNSTSHPRLHIGIQSDTLQCMSTFLRSEEFDAWLSGLKDKVGRARIAHRIRSAEQGNFGDCEVVGEGVSEMRIHVGPGYRAYFTRRAEVVYLLLLGGDKSSQKRNIRRAIEMARALDKE
jgi:putative addiction module killer protein